MADRGDHIYDVIVVGAGLSGLTSAYRLRELVPGCRVLVVEAKDRVGGRTMTVEMQGAHGPDSWDLGGQWVSSSQHHIQWLLQELGVEHYPQVNEGTKLLRAGKDFGITEHRDAIPSLPLLSLLDVNRFMSNMDSIAREVPSDEPWKAPIAEEYDGMTMEQLVESWTWTSVARETIQTGFQVVNGGKMREQSALSYIFYISSAGSNRNLVENTKGTAQELRIKGGAQGLSDQLVERLSIENILLSEPVVAIDQGQPDRVRVHTLSGKKLCCRCVIVAAPPHCAASIQYLPDPPCRRLRLLRHMNPGHLFKFVATYKKAFWREKGYSGEIVCNSSHSTVPGCEKGPVQYVLDATTSEGSPALVGFIGDGLHWGQVESDVRKAAILNHVAEFFGPEAQTPIDYVEKDWAREPYNGGCPVSYMLPGAMAYWDTIRLPHDRIYWAGTETATQWMGYLNGAVQAGLRAAEEVSGRLRPISDHPDCSDNAAATAAEAAAGETAAGQTNPADLLTTLDSRRYEAEDSCAGSSLIWTLGKLAFVAAFLGFSVRRVWLAGGRINLPWL
ncbi:probable flavin-containing monoamine oxidase A [Diadema setosum]|uniref:probable flavin-containing monoamine oxidase A n=1 Tax=Diadema setosum TaxID=31175 RepID=UPI003B3AFB88